jgi:hypothetical protein
MGERNGVVDLHVVSGRVQTPAVAGLARYGV